MIDFQKNELLNHAGEPKTDMPIMKSGRDGVDVNSFGKRKQRRPRKQKIDQPEIGDLNDGFIRHVEFGQFIFPVK
jgi:hypothetical protein